MGLPEYLATFRHPFVLSSICLRHILVKANFRIIIPTTMAFNIVLRYSELKIIQYLFSPCKFNLEVCCKCGLILFFFSVAVFIFAVVHNFVTLL